MLPKGLKGAIRNYREQINNIMQGGRDNIGEVPQVIGECGVPMDLNEKVFAIYDS